jgi:guanylate kinase
MFIRIVALLLLFSSQPFYAQGKFLLLMGPSGAGKSTVIRHLKQLDDRFIYVTPLTTRELRPNEQDKIHVSLEEIEALDKAGKLLTINCIYGIYYATPKELIDNALAQGKFPVLDWPINKLDVMEKSYEGQLYKAYVYPDDLQELQRRLSQDERDKDGKRYEAGVAEINNLIAGNYDKLCDLKIINKKDCDQEIARTIYQEFLASLSH